MRAIVLIGAVLAFVFVGCRKEPTACTVTAGDTLETHTPHRFQNCSEDADFHTWNFGNGFGVEEDNPLYQYADEADYPVTLTAYSKGGFKTDQVLTSVRVSERYLNRIEVEVLPGGTTNNGEPWDPNSDPDIQVSISTEPLVTITPISEDLSPASGPQVYDASTINNFIETGITGVAVLEVDGGGVSQVIWSVTEEYKVFRANPIVLTSNGVQVKVYWELR